MRRYSFVGLMQIDFPGYTMRICEGGFVLWNGEVFRSKDPVFGVIGEVQPLNEGVGEEVPVFQLTMLPPGSTPLAQLSQPGHQTAICRFWIGVLDVDAGTLVGDPEEQFVGEIDQTTIEFGAGSRVLELTIASSAKRLLERNIGNRLNPVWHKSIWPDETGHDNASGLGRNVAWGVEAPRGGSGSGGGGWGFSGSGGGSQPGFRAF